MTTTQKERLANRFGRDEVAWASRQMRRMAGVDRYMLATATPGGPDYQEGALYEMCRMWCNEHVQRTGTYY